MTACGARNRSGGPCQRPAGWGTDHAGYGRCKLHGGKTPNHQQAAQRQQVAEAVASLGLRRDVDPNTALLEEVHTAPRGPSPTSTGRCSSSSATRSSTITRTVRLPDGTRTVEARAAINVYVQLWQQERDRLVRVAKAAIDAGVA